VRVLLAGAGAVGTRAARELLLSADVDELTIHGRDRARLRTATEGLGPRVTVSSGHRIDIPPGTELVVVAQPAGAVQLARQALAIGAHVVTTVDHPDLVRQLLDLDGVARRAGRTIVVGAAMAPGLSCVLARFAAERVDKVTEVHVASFGTGGPACAHRHHDALSSSSTEWREGAWRHRPGGSGRELLWFPEPIGGADCYLGGLSDPLLLIGAFPAVERITARMEATRRDRLSAALPMLRRPHPEGTLGGVRVQIMGWSAGAAEAVIVGSVGRPALVAGVVAATAARWAVAGRLARSGAAGLAEMVDAPGAFLRELRVRGIKVAIFEGLSPGEVGAGL
jgi:saccharopine dehydrogenase-like NADP-dependent oxidoreductase